MAELSEIRRCIIDGDSRRAAEVTKAAIGAHVPANKILEEGLIPAMKTVGELFQKGQYFFPELLLAGEATKAALEHLRPILGKGGAAYTGKYAIGTVEGDIHDIGKNIIIMIFEANGWQVTDLGIDVSSDEFCEAVTSGDYDIIGMSALLSVTMPNFAKTIDALKSAGLRDKVKVMVGGAPVTQAYADQIGADGFARDGIEAVARAKSLVKKL